MSDTTDIVWTEADDVLFDFQDACRLPTEKQLAEWIRRHPEHAAALTAQACELWNEAAYKILNCELAADDPPDVALQEDAARLVDILRVPAGSEPSR